MAIKYRVIGWRYLQTKHNFAHNSVDAISAMEQQGRAAFLRGDPCDDDFHGTAEEIMAYRRGFNSEARMHGFE
jgi:hypothetical protein